MPRNTKNVELIGVYGEGEASARSIAALMTDFVGERAVRFVIPATETEYNESVAALMNWIDDNDLDYEVITNETSTNTRTLRNLVAQAKDAHEADADKTSTVLVNLLKPGGTLLALWSDELDEDGPTYAAIEYALDSGVEVRDLTNGLQILCDDSDGDTEEPAPAQESEEDEEPQPEPAPVDTDDEDGEESVELPTLEEAKKLKIRALKRIAREHLSPADVKKLPSMRDTADVLALLYPEQEEDTTADEEAAEEPEPSTPAPSDLQEQLRAAAKPKTATWEPPAASVRSAAVVNGNLAALAIDALAAAVIERLSDELADAVVRKVKERLAA
jgi:hypothetical protein